MYKKTSTRTVMKKKLCKFDRSIFTLVKYGCMYRLTSVNVRGV